MAIQNLSSYNVQNGVAIIIDPKSNELLSIVGSPDPYSNNEGNKINMALKPRAIGSTVKPFIYGLAFENGLRPYTLVDDREYKYEIYSGYAFYPKNYDYQYRGIVDLHYSLSNSLNVPTVKTLEYIGINQFSNFIISELEFAPTQDLSNYSLGIALGQLEMDPLSLAYYFSAFAKEGQLEPLKICKKNCYQNLNSNLNIDTKILSPEYIELVNSILSDKSTRVDQFGIKNNLENLVGDFAVKTGTSRDYHDSWIVGYSPEIVILAWIGNADESPMKDISGSIGAGWIWNKIVSLLKAENKIKGEPFDYKYITEYEINGTLRYGLENDNVEKYKNILIDQDNFLILNPHDGDRFLLEDHTEIPLFSKKSSIWSVNGNYIGKDKDIIFTPKEKGIFEIEAKSETTSEVITVFID